MLLKSYFTYQSDIRDHMAQKETTDYDDSLKMNCPLSCEAKFADTVTGRLWRLLSSGAPPSTAHFGQKTIFWRGRRHKSLLPYFPPPLHNPLTLQSLIYDGTLQSMAFCSHVYISFLFARRAIRQLIKLSARLLCSRRASGVIDLRCVRALPAIKSVFFCSQLQKPQLQG